MHYWLISAPAENGSKEETFKNLQRATSDMSANYKMKIPELRVGTLDSLMALSDDLERIDRSGPWCFQRALPQWQHRAPRSFESAVMDTVVHGHTMICCLPACIPVQRENSTREISFVSCTLANPRHTCIADLETLQAMLTEKRAARSHCCLLDCVYANPCTSLGRLLIFWNADLLQLLTWHTKVCGHAIEPGLCPHRIRWLYALHVIPSWRRKRCKVVVDDVSPHAWVLFLPTHKEVTRSWTPIFF